MSNQYEGVVSYLVYGSATGVSTAVRHTQDVVETVQAQPAYIGYLTAAGIVFGIIGVCVRMYIDIQNYRKNRRK